MGKAAIIEMQSGASLFTRTGWKNVLESIGYTCHIHRVDGSEHINDLFNKVGQVDLFLGTTYNLGRSHIKQIRARPDMKVGLYCSAWGDIADNIDKTEYPIQVVSEEEKKNVELIKDRISVVHIHTTDKFVKDYIGGWTNNLGIPAISVMNGSDLFTYAKPRFKEEYRADVSFVGGCWGYKAKTLNKYIVRLCREEWTNYNIKIFGQGWDVPQYLGQIDFGEDANVFASSRVCPNISEPHSYVFADLIERIFKVPISNGFLISDNVIGLDEIFPKDKCPIFKTYEEFKELVHFYTRPENGLKRMHLMMEQKRAIWAKHTYFDRMSVLLSEMNLINDAQLCLNKKEELFPFNPFSGVVNG